MKRFLVVLLSVLCSVSIVAALTGCSNSGHVHSFDKQVVSEEYLAKEATCTEKAKYYYSCECGAKGTSTFEIGEPLGHRYSSEWTTDENYHWHIATCEHANETTVKEAHIASDWIIDVEATYEQAGQRHKECTICRKVLATEELPQLTIDKITFNTLAIDDNNSTYIKVANEKANYNFAEEISVSGNAEYVVALDANGIYRSLTNVVPLTEGDNTFYVFEILSGEIKNTYTITIRRRPIYTIYLEDAANYYGYYEYQTVEEDSLATEPQSPEKAGYTFGGWNYDFSKAVTSDIYVNAAWSANTDTKYKVEYYWQNIEDDNYTLYESFDLQGTTDTQVYAEQKNYEHFSLVTYDYNYGYASIFSGNINGDGSLVLKLYYMRDRYSVNITNDNEKAGTVMSAREGYKYGSEITLNAKTLLLGYLFTGWYNGDTLLSATKDYTFIVEDDVYLTINWMLDERMSNYSFESTATTCTITGVKDYTITSIEIPEYVTEIGDFALFLLNEITDIHIYSIESWCNIIGVGNLMYPSSGTDKTNGKRLYLNGKELTELVIPDSVTSIENYAFFGCSGLTSVTISNRVTSIGDWAFNNCSGLTSVIIPDSVTSIGFEAFKYCSGLTSVIIPDSVTSIGIGAFYGCSGLTSITIPDSVTSILGDAFSFCSGLTSITVDKANTVYYSENNCLIEKSSKTLILGCQTSVIPEGVVTIGGGAFSGSAGLKSVIIPDSVISISPYAFSKCSGLKNVMILDSVTDIGMMAFSYCDSLTNIILPDSVVNIGATAFYECNQLKYNEYDTAYYLGNNDNPYHILIKAKDNITSCVINDQTKVIAGLAFSWRNIINNEVANIRITNIIIPDSVISIGYSAFSGIGLTSVTIGTGITSIGDGAFCGCDKLASITIPDSVTSIENYAFFGCSGLTSVIIPDSVTSIGNSAFWNCTGLTSITIPDSVTNIGDSAFSGCTGLTSITIPDSVTSIGENAFYGCDQLRYNECDNAYYLGNSDNPYFVLVKAIDESIYSCVINENTKIILSYAFGDCWNIKNIEIPANVIQIGDHAFYNCCQLTWITVDKNNTVYYSENNCIIEKSSKTLVLGCKSSIIPNGVTSIGNYAFEQCTGLTSITIPDGVISIGKWAFSDCTRLTSIIISDSVKNIEILAFTRCTNLKNITYKGTIVEWKNITKGSSWYYNSSCIIHCTDGDIKVTD